jgi:hypothetical protein
MAGRAAKDPASMRVAVAGVAFSTVATVVQLALLLLTISRSTLVLTAPALGAGALAAALYGLAFALRRHGRRATGLRIGRFATGQPDRGGARRVLVFMDWMTTHPTGLLDQVRGANVMGAAGWAPSAVTAVGGQITRALGYAVIDLFVAIYLAAQPERYRHLCLRLVPPIVQPSNICSA